MYSLHVFVFLIGIGLVFNCNSRRSDNCKTWGVNLGKDLLFNQACFKYHICYACGHSLQRLNKTECDQRFGKHMIDICNVNFYRKSPWDFRVCLQARDTYLSKARTEGDKHYNRLPTAFCPPFYEPCLKW